MNEITIKDVPVQWIPKVELYYPDLPQFPIMYIHLKCGENRIIACPVSVNYNLHGSFCDAIFTVLCNYDTSNDIYISTLLHNEISDRIGIKNKIDLSTVVNSCHNNAEYESLFKDLWTYVQRSYGSYIPYGRFYEEIYSIPRFVAAWQPKTGRQSEMRMLYNFMSAFGEEVSFPPDWAHLEYYIIPTYDDVQNKDYSDFPIFHKLYHSMKLLFNEYFTITRTIAGVDFKVMPRAWKQNKDDFITNVSTPLLQRGIFTTEDKFYSEKLVDAFNRHAWRAAYFISAFLNIENSDYHSWSKDFFKTFYDNGSALKGYSEKVIACFLQQGFGNSDVIPIDTWIETFYQFPLGISSKSDFYDSFDNLGKLERVIWLASQSNKTNMRDFFDILWCQRYGVIGNSELRGINPIACCGCKLQSSCVGLSKITSKKVLVQNNITFEEIVSLDSSIQDSLSFVCSLENNIPKKVYRKKDSCWILNDEFSGYLMTEENKLQQTLVDSQIITISDFINN